MFVLYFFSILCHSVSLDPDEDKRDATIFDGLKNYLLNEMTENECKHFKTTTLRNLAKRAQSLKSLRPPRGLTFFLQQQGRPNTEYLEWFNLLAFDNFI